MVQKTLTEIAIILTLLLGFYSSTVAAETDATNPSMDLSLTVSPDILGPNGDNVRIDVGFGWYLKPDRVVRLKLFHNVIEDIAPGENDYKSQALQFTYEKDFAFNDKWSPYIGASVGYRQTLFNDITESAPIYGPFFGVQYVLAESVALDVSVDYQLSDKKVFLVDFERDDAYLYLGIGFRVFIY